MVLACFWESALLRCSEGGDGSHVLEVLAGNHAFSDFQIGISRTIFGTFLVICR